MATQLSFVTLDVFTNTRYTGNPLAIVSVPQTISLSQSQKQRIAREFNLSETVFLHEQTNEDKSKSLARIDIFTSYAEIPFAGHPTVGTSNYLLGLLGVRSSQSASNVKALQTKAGLLGISLNPAIDGVQISVAHNVRTHANPFAGQSFADFPVVSIVKGMTFILAQQTSLEELGLQTKSLLGIDQTLSASRLLDSGFQEGIVVSYFFVDLGVGDDGVRNLRTRSHGSREDPATGSAASALTSYLSLKEGKPGRYSYHITQGVEMGQRSEIFVNVGVKEKSSGDGVEIEEVLLSGCAVLTMQGSLEIPGA
ncbi:uncharacterized protein A1O9_08573 [Exophiala aquamarina CBS 119918]|uniref:Phenazine biosynthesis protein n=1 Tax=Exophiala aquamarina CBS 119918 TaxID=1182545 RepID=A0A072P7Y9_9EURO|nr:uncharacterized protein A1O9_08573 [Exophiala aquamarina CBS 119918]KEF55822.1 hypothetical protein A1O9_08573 [Exophiala aquamarina CBS 119918]